MKNIKSYQASCIDLHRTVVNRKHTGDLKTLLLSIESEIEKNFLTYDENFSTKSLYKLTPNANLKNNKSQLLELYDYDSKTINDFRIALKKLQERTVKTTCQNCTIDTIGTLDHILPQAIFPEFVVHGKNLFPCCSKCNTYKSDNLITETSQDFLNLYLDELPTVQYLFTKIFLDEGELNFEFYLQNIDNKIPTQLYSTICTHFQKLRLFERMREKAVEYITEVQIKIEGFQDKLDFETIKTILINSIDKERDAYGYNHWKCVAELALLNSNIFLENSL